MCGLFYYLKCEVNVGRKTPPPSPYKPGDKVVRPAPPAPIRRVYDDDSLTMAFRAVLKAKIKEK